MNYSYNVLLLSYNKDQATDEFSSMDKISESLELIYCLLSIMLISHKNCNVWNIGQKARLKENVSFYLYEDQTQANTNHGISSQNTCYS